MGLYEDTKRRYLMFSDRDDKGAADKERDLAMMLLLERIAVALETIATVVKDGTIDVRGPADF